MAATSIAPSRRARGSGSRFSIFAIGYSIIATRLVMFAAVPDSHGARRAMGPDAVATARPDVLDRNGEILATDVRTPVAVRGAAPHHRCRRSFRAPHRGDDRRRCRRSCASGSLPSAASCGSSARSHPSSASRSTGSAFPASGSCPRTSASIPNGSEVSHIIGHVNIDNQGIAGIEKWLDTRGLADLHLAGLATDRLQKPIELAVDLRVQHAMRDELIAARSQFKALAARAC